MGEAHRRYTNFINARGRWTGHLFQSSFSSVVMDEAHLMAAARYVPLNPVRARLVARPESWPWSSASAHLAGRDDGLVKVRPLLDRIGDFATFLADDADDADPAAANALRAVETTGRPLGNEDFIQGLDGSWAASSSGDGPGPDRRCGMTRGRGSCGDRYWTAPPC